MRLAPAPASGPTFHGRVAHRRNLVVRAEPPRGALSLALTHSDPPRGEILRGAMSQKNVEIVRRLYEGVPAPLETPPRSYSNRTLSSTRWMSLGCH
jgi:hypothetical protein